MFSMVEIEINSKCNRSCWYCPNSIGERKEQGEMDESLFRTLMEQLRSVNFSGRISYHFYGEPLLCSNIELFVSLSKEYCPHSRSIVYTNGDYLDLGKLERLSNLGMDKFIVTQHVGPKHKFGEVYKRAPKHLKEKIEYLDSSDLNLSNRGGILTKIENKVDPKVTPCMVPSSLVVVTLKGNVMPCFEDFYQKYPMGNIKDSHIMDIWNSKKFTEFREDLRKGNRYKYEICKNCNNTSVMKEEQYDYVL
ncbi:SPASM domain-containing protein [Bacillus cereus]|nr:SPASM domain-containing protein [Bacillus cereus]